MSDLSENPLLDDETNKPSLVNRLVRSFIHSINNLKTSVVLYFQSRRPKSSDEQIKQTMEQYREPLENIRRTVEAKRPSRRVRTTNQPDLGRVLQNASERKAKARKAVQVAVRRSAPWVQGPRSPFE